MTKFLVSYLFKTTHPDLHGIFKKHAEGNNFCEYIYATDASGHGQYCQLPHTTLWCERKDVLTVRTELLNLADDVLNYALNNKEITPAAAILIRTSGGLIENLSILPLPAPTTDTTIMLVKEKTFEGKVTDNVSFTNCLTYQKANP